MLERFPVTFGLCAAVFFVFAIQFGMGGTMDPEVLMRLGALSRDRVWEHREFYRIFTAIFLHMGPIHIAFNGVALFQLCLLTEWIYGSTRALAFYLVCGLLGSLASMTLMSAYLPGSVGASGAIMGLAGLLFGLQLYGTSDTRDALNEMLGYRLLLGIGLTFGLGIAIATFFLPIVDNIAHAGGFVCGMLLAALYPDPNTPLNWSDRLACGGGLAMVVMAFGWAAVDGDEALVTFHLDTAIALEHRAESHPDGLVRALFVQRMVDAYRQADAPKTGQSALRDQLSDTDSPDTIRSVVGLLYDQGWDEENQIALERWLELEPDEAMALNALAWHHVMRTDLEKRQPRTALQLSERSLAILSGTEDEALFRPGFLDTKGEILLQLDRVEDAYAVQSEAVALARAQETSRLDRALVFLGLRSPPILEELETRLAAIEARR